MQTGAPFGTRFRLSQTGSGESWEIRFGWLEGMAAAEPRPRLSGWGFPLSLARASPEWPAECGQTLARRCAHLRRASLHCVPTDSPTAHLPARPQVKAKLSIHQADIGNRRIKLVCHLLDRRHPRLRALTLTGSEIVFQLSLFSPATTMAKKRALLSQRSSSDACVHLRALSLSLRLLLLKRTNLFPRATRDELPSEW